MCNGDRRRVGVELMSSTSQFAAVEVVDRLWSRQSQSHTLHRKYLSMSEGRSTWFVTVVKIYFKLYLIWLWSFWSSRSRLLLFGIGLIILTRVWQAVRLRFNVFKNVISDGSILTIQGIKIQISFVNKIKKLKLIYCFKSYESLNFLLSINSFFSRENQILIKERPMFLNYCAKFKWSLDSQQFLSNFKMFSQQEQ